MHKLKNFVKCLIKLFCVSILCVQLRAMEMPELLKAIRSGDCPRIQKLLDQGINYDIDEYGEVSPGFALREATRAGQFDIVKLLVDHGANVNARHSIFLPQALVWACELGRFDIAQFLLNHHADVHAGSIYGDDTPLKNAAQSGNIELVQLLLDYHTNIHASDGMGPDAAVRWAAQNGHEEIVRLLLDQGAHIDQGKGSPLVTAATFGHKRIVHLLLNRGAAIEAGDHTTALVEAIRHIEIEKLLLDWGADIEAKNCYGTALARAAAGDLTETINLLLDRGADINASGRFEKQPCYALWSAIALGKEKAAQLLIDRGADLLSSSKNVVIGCDDVTNAQIRTARLVLEHGACVEDGAALRWGGRIGEDVIRLLEFCSSHSFTCFRSNPHDFIEKVQKKEISTHPNQMILWTIILNNIDILQMILELYPEAANAAYTSKDGVTMTALMYASLFGFYDMVSILIRYGANIYQTNQQKQDAVTLATRHGHHHIAARLLVLQAKKKNLF